MEKGKYILVVEDSPTQAKQVEESLRQLGYRVDLAYSAKEALEAMDREKPLLVLADILMPEMDGYELCKAIKGSSSFKEIPVILLTQLSDPREVIRGMESGADDFIVKPYNERGLISRIEGVLGHLMSEEDERREIKVLVAEDSPTQAEQLRHFLEAHGYSVRTASDGRECLDLAKKDPPTLILSDILMPVMDGYELAYEVKKDEALKNVPVILITSLLDRKDIVQRASVVADGFFTKPYDERYLLSKIETLLSERKESEDAQGIEVSFSGEKYLISSDRRQILTFLLSIYENAVQQNRELVHMQNELQQLNEKLEERVFLRTRQLQESEAKHRMLLETSADAIVVVAEDNTLFFMNRAAEALFGVKAKGLAGMPFTFPVAGYEKQDMEIQNGGEKAYAEVRTVKTTWGEESAVLATFRDVTERKRVEKELRESEQNFRALADNAKDGILITGEDASIVYSNLRFADMLGYNVNEVFTKDFNGMIKGDAEHGEEVTLEGKGGMTVPVELAASRTLWHGVDATIVIVRNIAERKSREDEQLKASKLESLGTLAGGIAHDFNNLLTAIIGNVSLARLLGCGERGTKALNDADNAAQRAKDLTNQLLTFSRGGAPVKSVTSINGIVTDSASFSVLGSNIKCEIKLPEDLAPVEVDAGQISQVVHNVVLNAVQAMPGGGVITISAENVSLTNESGLPLSPGRYLRIDIRDTGPGIPEEHIGKVFDPYFTTKKGGSGLGLATVYSVVKNHDGYISLDTKPGSGTVFHIYLPASDTELAPQKAKVVEERPSIGRGRVLIMDDEEMIRDIAGKILVELGYEVDYAANGSEALEKYRVRMEAGSPFDAVILDLTIPAGMGGREAIKKLLELDPGARAIVSSGYSNDSIMSEYARFGFKAVIAKPYRIADLSNVVRQVVEGI